MEEVRKPYHDIRMLLSILDISLALSIILFSSTIIKTPIGGVSLIFGLIMLTIVTTLKIFQQW